MIGSAYLNYEIKKDELKIVIPALQNPISPGKNTINISSNAFKTVKVELNVSKKNESSYEVSKDKYGNIYIKKDFQMNLQKL